MRIVCGGRELGDSFSYFFDMVWTIRPTTALADNIKGTFLDRYIRLTNGNSKELCLVEYFTNEDSARKNRITLPLRLVIYSPLELCMNISRGSPLRQRRFTPIRQDISKI
jgi:hypothetical protein